MKAIPFPEQTKVLAANPNQTEIDGQPVGGLPIFTDGRQCVSRWSLSWRERFQIFWHGCVWLGIFSGPTQPPVWMSATNPIVSDPVSTE